MLPLGDRPLVFRVMEALNAIPADARILACPEDCVSVFTPLAEEAGFSLISGPKEDVLARYCLVIRQTGADRIIRATGDNPFVFIDAAIVLNQEAAELNADYAVYSGLPLGAGVECLASEALLRAEREATVQAEREHVCPYLYNHSERFKLHRPLAPQQWQESRLSVTVDTKEDYDRALGLFQRLSSLPVEERGLGKQIIQSSLEMML